MVLRRDGVVEDGFPEAVYRLMRILKHGHKRSSLMNPGRDSPCSKTKGRIGLWFPCAMPISWFTHSGAIAFRLQAKTKRSHVKIAVFVVATIRAPALTPYSKPRQYTPGKFTA